MKLIAHTTIEFDFEFECPDILVENEHDDAILDIAYNLAPMPILGDGEPMDTFTTTIHSIDNEIGHCVVWNC